MKWRHILIIIIIFSILAPIIKAQNDTWHDRQWGGDTGEEYYEEPKPEPEDTRDGGSSLCSTWGCTSAIAIIAICMPYIVRIRKRRLHEK